MKLLYLHGNGIARFGTRVAARWLEVQEATLVPFFSTEKTVHDGTGPSSTSLPLAVESGIIWACRQSQEEVAWRSAQNKVIRLP